MKTLTEFDGFSLKKAIETKKQLTTAGKTAEELPQAMGEALKMEGDKLTWFLAAIELVESKSDHLKRVVVYALNEGEKAPQGAVQKGEKHFLTEYFFVPQPKRQPRGDHKGGRPGGKGKRGGGKDRGRGGGGRNNRNPRDNRNPAQAAGGKPGAPGAPKGPQNPQGQKKPHFVREKKPFRRPQQPGTQPANAAKPAAPEAVKPADSAAPTPEQK